MKSSAPSAHRDYLGVRFFSSLDGLRAISILAVIWHHCRLWFPSIPITERGFLGVDMFFVLSGFLIITLLLRERARHGSISLSKFYGRRALRIFPVYYAVILGLALYFGVIRTDGKMSAEYIEHLPFFLTHTSNWIHDHTFMSIAWSLSTEEQFYLVWPLVTKLLGGGKDLVLLAAVILFNQAINFRLVFADVQLDILQATFTPICLGVLLAHLLHSPRGFAVVHRGLAPAWTPVAAGAVVCAVLMIPGDIAGWPRLTAQVSMMVLLAACVVRERHWLSPLLTAPPVKRIGAVSYGMYLFHMIVLHFAAIALERAGLASPWLLLVLVTLGTVLVAELSFRLYESPILRFKEKLVRV